MCNFEGQHPMNHSSTDCQCGVSQVKNQNNFNTCNPALYNVCTITREEKIARLEQMLECHKSDVAAIEARISCFSKEQ